jgi:hypothetical protein
MPIGLVSFDYSRFNGRAERIPLPTGEGPRSGGEGYHKQKYLLAGPLTWPSAALSRWERDFSFSSL